MYDIDFIIAKIHGIHSKSVLGENYIKLKKVDSIEKLNRELFDEERTEIPTKKLYTEIERIFKKKIYKQILDISRYFNHNNELINSAILKFEIENVKIIINSYINKDKSVKNLFEIKLQKTIDYQLLYKIDITDFNNIKRLFDNTIFKFVVPMLESNSDRFLIENELDKFYYKNILSSIERLKTVSKSKILSLLIEEINWQNIIWALRTKFYFNRSFHDIEKSFFTYKGVITKESLRNIFELDFVPNEIDKIFGK